MKDTTSHVVGAPNESGALLRDLLDSSLIVATNKEKYDIKVISCNDYIQIYYLPNTKIKKVKNLETLEEKDIKIIDTDNLIKTTKNTNYIIEDKNIIRSKLECQRIAKCNAKEWKTFITLTFKDNITNIDYANKRFRCFINKIKRIFKDFKYISIPEFQKRGAVHYHLLTNINIDDNRFMFLQADNKKFKHIKYWIDGFTKVDNLDNDIKKIIGYISKYMTKDIDNRLYNHHRYFYSRNLKKPNITYLDLTNTKHLEYYKRILKNKNIIYENTYLNPYNDDLITFKEYL